MIIHLSIFCQKKQSLRPQSGLHFSYFSWKINKSSQIFTCFFADRFPRGFLVTFRSIFVRFLRVFLFVLLRSVWKPGNGELCFCIGFYCWNRTSALQGYVKKMKILFVVRPVGQNSVRHAFWHSFWSLFGAFLRVLGAPLVHFGRPARGSKKALK